MRRLLPVLAVVILSFPCSVKAQAKREFVEKPLWIMWHTGFSETAALSYVKRVAKQSGIAGDLSEDIRREFDKDRSTDQPIKGTAMFLVKGLIPSVDTIEFRELKDPGDFEKIVRARQHDMASGAVAASDPKPPTITGTGNMKKVELNHRYTSPKYEMKKTKGPDGKEQQSFQPVIGEDGKPVMETSGWTEKVFFRLEKGILFESRFEELHTMELPKAETFGVGRRKRTDDLYFHADLKLVPQGLKSVFWNLVSTQVNSAMQQRDGENRIPYEFRKSASKMWRELLRSAVFDIDEATGSIKFATATKPAQAAFDLKVRSNSKLAKQLRDLRRGRAKMPTDEDAVLSLRSTWAMPKTFQELLNAAGPYLRKIADEELGDSDASAGMKGIADALETSADEGTFETAINFGGTQESGPVLYGAIRAEEASKLSAGLRSLLDYVVNKASEPNLPSIDGMNASGRSYVKISFPDLPWPSDLKPDHAFLTGDKSGIWFAFGRESAWKILESQAASQKRPKRSALLDLRVDFARLVAKDDPAGLGELGKKLDLEFDKLAVDSAYGNEFKGDLKMPPNHELLGALLSGGESKLSLVVDSNKDGVAARASIDEPLAKYFVARYMSTVNRIMARQKAYTEKLMQQQIQEATQKAAEAASGE